MKTRIISAIVMLPLLILVYLGGIWLKMAVVIISVIGLDEFYKGFKAEGVKPSFPIGIASVILLHIFHTINAQMGADGPDSGVLYALWLFIVVVACMIYGFKVEERKTEDMASTALGIIYVPFLFHFAVLIDECDYAKNYIWLVFIIAFGTDIFAYFSGVFLGKHKLCPTSHRAQRSAERIGKLLRQRPSPFCKSRQRGALSHPCRHPSNIFSAPSVIPRAPPFENNSAPIRISPPRCVSAS